MSYIQSIIISLPVLLVVITAHEYAHGLAAYILGDPTAKYLGRLSLNPIKHIDPIGILMLIVFRFGWAKPVPVNPRNFQDPLKGMALVAAAGPATNFFFAWVLVLAGVKIFPTLILSSALIKFMWQYAIWINIALAIFNLIPINPLDGSRILAWLIPREYALKMQQFEEYGMILLVALIWFTPALKYLIMATEFINQFLFSFYMGTDPLLKCG